MISETFLFRLLTNVSSSQAKSWKQNLKHEKCRFDNIFFLDGGLNQDLFIFTEACILADVTYQLSSNYTPLPPTSTSEIQNWGGDLVVFTCSLWYDIFCTWIFFLIYLSWQILLCLNAKAKAIFRNFKFRISAGSRKLL